MMWLSWKLFLFLSLTGCLSEYSEAVPGLPTSYAAILRIKSASSSLASFNSKNRPRLSSPSLGSVSSPGWRGAAQHYHYPTNLYHLSEAFKHDELKVQETIFASALCSHGIYIAQQEQLQNI
ncbi:hypothetical protein AV530_010107 [Patagioenas fasciata monilis]|uniref:Uncharacterized protein n=1 Tax=Patagioenas fasciata monilis TaxID=372326 RepID=A0A1V4L0N7_PATFA|nr:hypothetical protein AV530_010107 [Patagioenas fasciata monilis]